MYQTFDLTQRYYGEKQEILGGKTAFSSKWSHFIGVIINFANFLKQHGIFQ